LALAWTAVVTLVPAPTKVVGRRVRWGRRALVAVLVLVTRHPRWILTAVGVVSVAALPGVFALRFTSNPLDYFPPGAAVVRDFRALNTKLTGMLPFRVSVAGGCDAAARLADTPGVRKVVEVSEFDRSANRVYWCFADNDAVLDLMRAAPEWREWARERGCLVRWTGVAAQIAGVVDTITRVAVLSLPLMVLLAAVVVTLLSKNLLLALLSAWINALPVLCLILLTALARWPLGLPALMIGAIGIGMAIDDTIHVVRGLARGWSVRRTLLYCWQPCAGSTVVVAVCLALFACAPFRPTAQFGVLLSLGSLAALAGDLLALPAAWVVIRRASISRG
jgi:predicted RND superfamily exporter protein